MYLQSNPNMWCTFIESSNKHWSIRRQNGKDAGHVTWGFDPAVIMLTFKCRGRDKFCVTPTPEVYSVLSVWEEIFNSAILKYKKQDSE
jgi:hypothetical protein